MPKRLRLLVSLAAFFLSLMGDAPAARGDPAPDVIAPPESFFEKVRDRDREVARKFYKKYIDVMGLSVVASAEVADEALQRTHYLVTHLLAGRPDILQAMVKNGTRLIIIGKDQVYTDMPEYRNHPNPTYPERARAGHRRLRRHQLRRGEPAQLAPGPLRRREHRRPRVLPHHRRRPGPDRSRLARAAVGKPTATPWPGDCGRTPTRPPTRPNTGPRFANPISTATGSTTGTTTPSARASS